MKRTLSIIASFVLLGSVACDKPGQDAEKKIDNAQEQGTTEITNAQVKENDKVAAAEADFAKSREDYRHDMQTNLDQLDKSLSNLDGKAQKAVGADRSKLTVRSQSLHTQRDPFARDVESLGSTSASDWDATKARVDHEWDVLKKNTDKTF
ncbi:MAG TPA: hypothetical protein VGH28_01015 [Polyangiaceae bacterium]|jgi:hypothetical protein